MPRSREKSRGRPIIWFGGLALVGSIAGALTLFAASRPGRALWLGTRGCHPWPRDGRILAEDGIDPTWAAGTAAILDSAIDRVEELHGRPFVRTPTVVLCAGQESFNRRIGAEPGGHARGAVLAGNLFLSPRAFSTGTARTILTHELSHLHLRQRLGSRYTTGVPGWFQEGLAVYVSDGGGAERVTEAEAIRAVREGDALAPESTGSWRPRTATGHGLDHFQFYRQSGMFVAYLAERDPEAFRRTLRAVQDGSSFAEALSLYDVTLEECWRDFVDSISPAGRSPD